MDLQTQMAVGFFIVLIGKLLSDFLSGVTTDFVKTIGRLISLVGSIVIIRSLCVIAKMLDSVIT